MAFLHIIESKTLKGLLETCLLNKSFVFGIKFNIFRLHMEFEFMCLRTRAYFFQSPFEVLGWQHDKDDVHQVWWQHDKDDVYQVWVNLVEVNSLEPHSLQTGYLQNHSLSLSHTHTYTAVRAGSAQSPFSYINMLFIKKTSFCHLFIQHQSWFCWGYEGRSAETGPLNTVSAKMNMTGRGRLWRAWWSRTSRWWTCAHPSLILAPSQRPAQHEEPVFERPFNRALIKNLWEWYLKRFFISKWIFVQANTYPFRRYHIAASCYCCWWWWWWWWWWTWFFNICECDIRIARFWLFFHRHPHLIFALIKM